MTYRLGTTARGQFRPKPREKFKVRLRRAVRAALRVLRAPARNRHIFPPLTGSRRPEWSSRKPGQWSIHPGKAQGF